MLTLVICLVVLDAVPIHADNVELTSTKTRRFTCPGDRVTFTCRVFRSSSLEWRSPLITQTTSYLATDTPPRILNRGPLSISLISVSGTTLNSNFTSTLRVTASRTITRTTVTCLSGTLESETDNFTVAEIPTIPLNVTVDAEGTSRRGNTTIRLGWMQPHQFDVNRYDITVTSTSGVQNTTTACGHCTSAVITVSENPNNVWMNTTFTATIAAVNLCGENGPTATASYTLINCGDPVVPANGFIEAFQNTSEGAEIVFKCNTTVVPPTRMTATCTSNGMWTPDPGSLNCAFDCGPPTAPQHGSLESYTDTTEGSVVFYSCDPGLVPEGTMRTVCTGSGWSPNPADLNCTIVNCKIPVAPGNGSIVNIRNTLGGAELFLRCNSGFVPTGRMRVVCMSDGISVDGSWTPDPTTLVCNASIVDCGAPPPLASGVTVEAYNSTAVNSDIFFQCHQPSDRSASCGSDGRWSPDPSQVECRMPIPADTTLATGSSDTASTSCSTSVTITAVVSCAVSFILGALVGPVVYYCTVRKKCDCQKEISHKAKKQQSAPVYEDVISPSQTIKLKENVAYGPVLQ